MTKRKIFLWTGLVLSIPAAFYTGGGFVYYVWLNAAQPERWPAERAAPWAYSHLILAVFFLGLFIYCVFSLIREANRKYREHNI